MPINLKQLMKSKGHCGLDLQNDAIDPNFFNPTFEAIQKACLEDMDLFTNVLAKTVRHMPMKQLKQMATTNIKKLIKAKKWVDPVFKAIQNGCMEDADLFANVLTFFETKSPEAYQYLDTIALELHRNGLTLKNRPNGW